MDLSNFDILKQSFEGDLMTDSLARLMLSTDASIFQIKPMAVACPRNLSDVLNLVKFAKERNISIHPRGAGSGLCGSSLGKGIIIDFTKYMNRLIKLDIENKYFECEPGCTMGEVNNALKETGLFFPPDPSSAEFATLGGMFATNASGAHSVKYGNVADYILDAQIVLSWGKVITLSQMHSMPEKELFKNFRAIKQLYDDNKEKIESAYPKIKYNVAGYNLRMLVQNGFLCLDKLFAGSEGTLGIVTKLKFRLIPKPKYDSLVVAFFDNIVSSAKAVQKILPTGPSGIEILDKSLLNLAANTEPALKGKIPEGIDNAILMEFDSDDKKKCSLLAENAKKLIISKGFTNNAHIAVSSSEKEKFWAVRKAAVPILYKLKGNKKILAIIEDAAVPTDFLVDFFKGIYEILEKHKVDFVIYGHIAKGLLHTRPLLDLKDKKDVAMLKILGDEIFNLVKNLEGTVSGEHGDGRLRSAYIKRRYPAIYDLFIETKRILDPHDLLNPEIKKSLDPDQMIKFLRFGENYKACDIKGKSLAWPQGFLNETEKCHGCSKCTTITTATRMCPIYKFTRDEMAAPKAKANILRALISGKIEKKAIYEKNLQKIMKTCINCGTCYFECPSNINIPKMAMEAKAFYVKKFGAAAGDKITSGIENGARLRKFSRVIKKASLLHPVRLALEKFGGISASRDLAVFETKSLFERIKLSEGKGSREVLYFAGCYAGYIRPEIGEAAVKVMTNLGMKVHIPGQHCCGLPMISKGMAYDAAAKIKANLEKWRNLMEKVEYIVVTCSSCGLFLGNEWEYFLSFMPDKMEAIKKIGKKLIHISALVNKTLDFSRLTRLNEKGFYHMPCHLKIQKDSGESIKMLSKIKEFNIHNPETHCCGMAGTWGLMAENFDLSLKIGSDMLKKFNDSDAAFGITDCPTCRMQMEEFGKKPVFHPIEVIAKLM